MAEQMNFSPQELEYLSLLAKDFPTAQDTITEIINLHAILNYYVNLHFVPPSFRPYLARTDSYGR